MLQTTTIVINTNNNDVSNLHNGKTNNGHVDVVPRKPMLIKDYAPSSSIVEKYYYNYVYEEKLSGPRILIVVQPKLKIQHCYSFYLRNNDSMFNDLLKVSAAYPGTCIVDGQIVFYDRDGEILHHHNWYKYERTNPGVRRVLHLFDIQMVNGLFVTNMTLAERKKLLTDAIEPTECIKIVPYHLMSKIDNYENFQPSAHIAKTGCEYVIIKHLYQKYMPGQGKWLKLKVLQKNDEMLSTVDGKTTADCNVDDYNSTNTSRCGDGDIDLDMRGELMRKSNRVIEESTKMSNNVLTPVCISKKTYELYAHKYVVPIVATNKRQPYIECGYYDRFKRFVHVVNVRRGLKSNHITQVQNRIDLNTGYFNKKSTTVILTALCLNYGGRLVNSSFVKFNLNGNAKFDMMPFVCMPKHSNRLLF